MHELSLCKNILELIEQNISKQNNNHKQTIEKVTKITLGIGELSCVDKHALQFSFEVIAKDTIVQNAQLLFNTIPGKAYCNHCKKNVLIKSLYQICDTCDNYLAEIIEGRNVFLQSVEVA